MGPLDPARLRQTATERHGFLNKRLLETRRRGLREPLGPTSAREMGDPGVATGEGRRAESVAPLG